MCFGQRPFTGVLWTGDWREEGGGGGTEGGSEGLVLVDGSWFLVVNMGLGRGKW